MSASPPRHPQRATSTSTPSAKAAPSSTPLHRRTNPRSSAGSPPRGGGADVNARGGYDESTPLHTAAWCDKPEAAAALIDAGADINIKSGSMHNNQPLGWAIVGGSLNTVRTLLARGAAVQPHHIEDAQKGTQGAFREFNPNRPLQNWHDIATALAASGPNA